MIKDPIDSLWYYVLDNKPYHTKVIEVFVEHYHEEDLSVSFEDAIEFKLRLNIDHWKNPHLAGFDTEYFDATPFDLPDYQHPVGYDPDCTGGFDTGTFGEDLEPSFPEYNSPTNLLTQFTETIRFIETIRFSDDLDVVMLDVPIISWAQHFADTMDVEGDDSSSTSVQLTVDYTKNPHLVGFDTENFDSTPFDTPDQQHPVGFDPECTGGFAGDDDFGNEFGLPDYPEYQSPSILTTQFAESLVINEVIYFYDDMMVVGGDAEQVDGFDRAYVDPFWDQFTDTIQNFDGSGFDNNHAGPWFDQGVYDPVTNPDAVPQEVTPVISFSNTP